MGIWVCTDLMVSLQVSKERVGTPRARPAYWSGLRDRLELDAALRRLDGSKGGRPPLDSMRTFKVLVLQAL